ncbi:LacI family DNA-binding transcriptional regulator [Pseudomonas typographi]|uniref:LacI family DNA-binding transcriptional regulator n=1 Tax=Pseudomonas typographi TaxID=2715964 RepID=A0ABR7Z3V3_9PSED|nr:LacI family DNA-binding transcriptional regulator [Pseudomonas typographi]MBD1552738.1 LacI family DNA-binding transcriptional regulator [Pseudomonas typographi]MBD1600190.1 LacI family DNA-binding transcriptional regulator [Pseudomonas typographi]
MAQKSHSGRHTGGVTLIDVARLAGVAPMTVSRVLNQPEAVREGTRDKVLKAIEQTGYVPNRLAGALASNRSRLVAVIVPMLTNPIFSDTFQAVAERLASAGYQVLLGMSGYQADREQELLEVILSRRPDGIILTGTLHTEGSRQRLKASGVPVVETWDLTDDPIDMLVGFSHEQVGQQLATHLLGKGYRRFALLKVGDPRGMRRSHAFAQALQGHGVALAYTERFEGLPSLAQGREGLGRLLERGAGEGGEPLMVVCTSDTIAHGVLTEAAARGLRVPQQVAVMGFGDMVFAAYTFPALSTVRIDGRTMGDAAAALLMARLNGNDGGPPLRDIGFSLVDRQSTV